MMRSSGHVQVLLVMVAGLILGSSAARADYVLEITDGDATPHAATLSPGQAITLFAVLTGPAGTQHDAFIVDVVFSTVGLLYHSYALSADAFQTGAPDGDFSIPAIDELTSEGSPHVVSASSYAPSWSLADDVEIHFEALTTTDAAGTPLTFETGVLVRIDLSVPAAFHNGDILIEAVPDAFSFGFEFVDTIAGVPFTLTVVGGTPAANPSADDGAPDVPPAPDSGSLDDDSDGVANSDDLCEGTLIGTQVDPTGCPFAPPDTPEPPASNDDDADGIENELDACPDTPPGVVVDDEGCEPTPDSHQPVPADTDGDGIDDDADSCPDTPAHADVDEDGCEVEATVASDDDSPAARPGTCGAIGMVGLSWIFLGLLAISLAFHGRRAPSLATQGVV